MKSLADRLSGLTWRGFRQTALAILGELGLPQATLKRFDLDQESELIVPNRIQILDPEDLGHSWLDHAEKFASVTLLISETQVKVYDPTTETLFEGNFRNLGEIAAHLAPARFGAHQVVNRKATEDLGVLLGSVKNHLVEQSSGLIEESHAALLCLRILRASITNHFDSSHLALGETHRLGSKMPREVYLAALSRLNEIMKADCEALSPNAIETISKQALQAQIAELLTADFSSIYPETLGPYLTRLNPPKASEDPWFWYASEQNVLKLIRPLFLEEVEGKLAFNGADKTLSQKIDAVTNLSFLDPSDSPGSFHTATISGLSFLLEQASPVAERKAARLSVKNFVQICSNPEAAEVARFAIWFAYVKHLHQIGLETAAEDLQTIWRHVDVRVQNQLTAAWTVSGEGNYPDFIYGAPKFLGANLQSDEEKASKFAIAPGNYDLSAAWLIKAAQLCKGGGPRSAFVLTSSVTKGSQVISIWKAISRENVEISFAWAPFRWAHGSINQSTVSVVVIALTEKTHENRKPILFEGKKATPVEFISPHLIPDIDSLIPSEKKPSSVLMPEMKKGVMPYATSSLILSEETVEAITDHSEQHGRYIRPFVGGDELLKGIPRQCLWIVDEELGAALQNPIIAQILDDVVLERQNMAQCPEWLLNKPNRYRESWETKTISLAIPQLSSEDRPYIPIDIFGPDVILSNLAHVIYDSPFWVFSLLSSSLHNLWARTFAGGRETRIRYNIDGIYNTFPFPSDLSAEAQTELEDFGQQILDTREESFEIPLGKLYRDMPDRLRAAHSKNDEFVSELLGVSMKLDDRQQLESLLRLKKAQAHD